MGHSAETSPSFATRLMSAVICFCAVIMVLGVAAGYGLSRQFILETYDDFDVAIPTLTVLILKIPTAGSFIAGGLISAALIAQQSLLRDPLASGLINLAAGMIAVIFGGILLVALHLPFIKLMQSIM